MSALPDSDMQELLDAFAEESRGLLEQLEESLEEFEDDMTQTQHLEKFGQIIDRMMGAAKSIQLEQTSKFCELGKIIGYKSSQIKQEALLNIVVGILFDSIDILNQMIANLEQGKGESLENINTEAFGSRLEWLSEKFSHIERGSVAIDEDAPTIESILSDLGLKQG